MTAAICLNGQAVVCFLDGSKLTISYHNLEGATVQLKPRPNDQQAFLPKDLFKDLIPEKNSENNNESSNGNLLTYATFSNDAQLLAVVNSSKNIFVLLSSNTREWTPKYSFQIEKRGIVTLKFLESNDGLTMVDKAGEVYILYFTETGQVSPPRKLLGHCSYISDMILIGDHILTSDRDAKIRLSLFPDSHVIERYFLGHKKAVIGIAGVCFEKFLLSVTADGECILWSLNPSKEQGDEVILNVNLSALLEMNGVVLPEEKTVVDNLKVTTFRGRTFFAVKVISPDSASKFNFVFELVFQKGKGFNIHPIVVLNPASVSIEGSELPELLDFVLIGNLLVEYHFGAQIVVRKFVS